MKNNKLIIQIDKSAHEVFLFVITPPNSTFWIESVVSEETNEWPVGIGTIYRLSNNNGKIFEVTVETIDEDKIVGWISDDKNYHCQYELKPINNTTTKFTYTEWVDNGEINGPFTQEILEKLKQAIENLEPRH